MLSRYQFAGLTSLGGVSLFFVFIPLVLIGFTVPQGPEKALWIASSYFLPLALWTLLLSDSAARLTARRRSYAFLFSLGGISFAIACSWAFGSIANANAGFIAYVNSMMVSLPALVLLLFFGVPLALIAGFFFLGSIERN